MSESKVTIPLKAMTQYDKLIAANTNIERKGKTSPYTSVNGHMFSFLSKSGVMGLRLPKAALDSFLEEYETQLMEQHGHTMKEYVQVPSALLENTEKLSTYLQIRFAHTSSLKPVKKK